MANKSEQIESEDAETLHSMVYRAYKLFYYIFITIGAIVGLLLFDVALLGDYSMRQPMFYLTITGFGVLIAERMMDWKLTKWGVIA